MWLVLQDGEIIMFSFQKKKFQSKNIQKLS